MRKKVNQASFLELLFEGRNKSYGAYVLRRDYSQRMGTALGIMLSGILFLCLWFQWSSSAKPSAVNTPSDRDWMKFSEVHVQPPMPKAPEPMQTARASAPKTATQKFTSTIDIKNTVKDPMPSTDELKSAAVSTVTQIGIDPGQVSRPVEPTVTNGGGVSNENQGADFRADERQPAFPGGEMALRNFLATYLQTPSSMEEGERRTVRVRFTVLADGRVDQITIEVSGGAEFDREVMRVCKRMPRWVPGSQNGQAVSVQYVLPVTFLSTGS